MVEFAPDKPACPACGNTRNMGFNPACKTPLPKGSRASADVARVALPEVVAVCPDCGAISAAVLTSEDPPEGYLRPLTEAERKAMPSHPRFEQMRRYHDEKVGHLIG